MHSLLLTAIAGDNAIHRLKDALTAANSVRNVRRTPVGSEQSVDGRLRAAWRRSRGMAERKNLAQRRDSFLRTSSPARASLGRIPYACVNRRPK